MTWHRTVTVIRRLSLLLLLQLAQVLLLLRLAEELLRLLLLLRLEAVGLDDRPPGLLHVHLVRRPLLLLLRRRLLLLLRLGAHAGDGAALGELAAVDELAHVFCACTKWNMSVM